MPDHNAIADVSLTVRDYLANALGGTTVELHDLSTAVSTNPARLTIFLFEVVEDSSVRNRAPARIDNPPNYQERKPPVPLLLRYLMTPWSGDPQTDHRILGRTVQTLYDNAIISGTDLQGVYANTSEALKFKLAPLTLEERTRVWAAVNKPYRLSVTYEVRVVNVDAVNQITRKPIQSRNLDASARSA